MKKIYKDKLYDTETADVLHFRSMGELKKHIEHDGIKREIDNLLGDFYVLSFVMRKRSTKEYFYLTTGARANKEGQAAVDEVRIAGDNKDWPTFFALVDKYPTASIVITKMTEEQVKEDLSNRLSIAEYEKIFGPLSE